MEYLGDIAISPANGPGRYAKKKKKTGGKTFERTFEVLILHGRF